MDITFMETEMRINLKKKMHRTSKFEKSSYYSCVGVFERIPNSIRYSPIKDFKNQLTHYLCDKCF